MHQATSSSSSQAPAQAGRGSDGSQAPEHLTLRLVPKRPKQKKAVKWAEDVVDNEHMNKRSSKQCCIFHKQRQFGDWDDDDDDGDSECSGPGSGGQSPEPAAE